MGQACAGFTVFATANTKGKGSDDGRFIGTGVLNEAFLDRFPVTLEQEYAPRATEKKIVKKAMSVGIDDNDFRRESGEVGGDHPQVVRRCYRRDHLDAPTGGHHQGVQHLRR